MFYHVYNKDGNRLKHLGQFDHEKGARKFGEKMHPDTFMVFAFPTSYGRWVNTAMYIEKMYKALIPAIRTDKGFFTPDQQNIWRMI